MKLIIVTLLNNIEFKQRTYIYIYIYIYIYLYIYISYFTQVNIPLYAYLSHNTDTH